MRTYFCILCILQSIFCWSQDSKYYFINAKSGLNVRSGSNLSAKKIAKIPYGALVEKLEDTNKELIINDDGKQINGSWVKIRFNNYIYLVSEKMEQFQAEGYVFDGFLKKKNEIVVTTQNIVQSQYNKLLQKAVKNTYNPKKIGDLDSIKAIVKNRIKWVTEFEDEDYKRDDAIKSIIIDNGQELLLGEGMCYDVGFSEGWSGYYPEEGILTMEGGHSSDMCFSIKTGETDLTIGNPMYIEPSPNGTYRLNGSFGGQECISYFFQIKKNNTYEYLGVFNEGAHDFICEFKTFYWISEHQFIYTKINYSKDSVNGVEEYYLGEITE